MIYLTGDTHGDIDRFEKSRDMRSVKKGDTLIVCGDFGFIWEGGKKEEKCLKKIGKKKYTTLFVPGASENYKLLGEYPEVDFAGGKALQISGNLYCLLTGHRYEIEGKKILAFGGGRSLDASIVRPEDETAGEIPDAEVREAALALAEEEDADLIVSYEPPYSIANFLDLDNEHDSFYGLYLDQVVNACKFHQWYFGKYHQHKRVTPRFMGLFDKVESFDN